MWRLCRGKESDQSAEEAVAVLEALPPGKELAWAYGNLAASSQSLGLSQAETLRLLDKARDLGERLGHPDVVCYALNAAGLHLINADRDGTPEIEESLRLALASDLPEAAGRAYSSLVEASVRQQRFADANHYYADGLAYCEGGELGVFIMCLNGWQARGLVLTGRWAEAAEICARSLGSPGISPVNQLNPLCALATIRGRRGEEGGMGTAGPGAGIRRGDR